MAKSKFVDNQLIKIRDKLPSVSGNSSSVPENGGENNQVISERLSMEFVEPAEKRESVTEEQAESKEKKAEHSKPAKRAGAGPVANEREWKKAVFRRWDEFKNIKQDMLKRLAEAKVMIPREKESAMLKIKELETAAGKIEALLEEIKAIDDSEWNRDNFTSELGAAMRKIDHCRLEYMMTVSKLEKSGPANSAVVSEPSAGAGSVIHELSSLSFQQCFKLGFGFFMPLIIAVFIATLLWGAIYFISIH
jgi:hypothetical protein